MNVDRIRQIVAATTREFQKENLVTEGWNVAEIWAMPPIDAVPPGLNMVDVHFMTIGVDVSQAAAIKDELVTLLSEYPKFCQGPSYIEIGAALDSQEDALRLLALGEALGLSQVITPARMGIRGRLAEEIASAGLISVTGFHPK